MPAELWRLKSSNGTDGKHDNPDVIAVVVVGFLVLKARDRRDGGGIFYDTVP